jgi:NADPH:quinone reductase-like Zn-dependent oxidoreductase
MHYIINKKSSPTPVASTMRLPGGSHRENTVKVKDLSAMRAIEFDEYGPAGVLKMRAVPRPELGPGEALVRVHASTVNPIDTIIRSGVLKFRTGKNFPKRIGIDFAGEVVALGTDSIDLSVGDRVWGVMPLTVEDGFGQGSAADYVTVPMTRLAKSPLALDFVQAAALSSVGAVAIIALIDKAELKAGERLLVRGGAGGVGSVAIQVGRQLGAHVTALGSSKDLEFLCELGADVALDYRTNAAASLPAFDVILDLVGDDLGAYRRRLTPQGRMYCLAVKGLGAIIYFQLSKIYGRKRVNFFSADPLRQTMSELTCLVDQGALRPIVDSVYALEDIALAHGFVEAGHVRGKRVLRHTHA